MIAGTTVDIYARRGLTPAHLLRSSTSALAESKDTLNALAKLADTQLFARCRNATAAKTDIRLFSLIGSGQRASFR
jgi:hypothetical protein